MLKVNDGLYYNEYRMRKVQSVRSEGKVTTYVTWEDGSVEVVVDGHAENLARAVDETNSVSAIDVVFGGESYYVLAQKFEGYLRDEEGKCALCGGYPHNENGEAHSGLAHYIRDNPDCEICPMCKGQP